jgi:hypothetical protein
VTKVERHWVVVSWSPPIQPNGIIHYYLVGVQNLTSKHRNDNADQLTLPVNGLTYNVTDLSPFSNYSVQVAAVTIRSHDSKVLQGSTSNISYFQTEEDGK